MAATREAIADALGNVGREVTDDDAAAFDAVASSLTGLQDEEHDDMAPVRALLAERFGVTGPGPRIWRLYQALLAGRAG